MEKVKIGRLYCGTTAKCEHRENGNICSLHYFCCSQTKQEPLKIISPLKNIYYLHRTREDDYAGFEQDFPNVPVWFSKELVENWRKLQRQ